VSLQAYLRPDAREDLRDAAIWYEARLEGLGGAFINEFLECISRIEDNPASYQRVDGEVCKAVLHRFPYTMFYVVELTHIEVLSILRSSRAPEIWRLRV